MTHTDAQTQWKTRQSSSTGWLAPAQSKLQLQSPKSTGMRSDLKFGIERSLASMQGTPTAASAFASHMLTYETDSFSSHEIPEQQHPIDDNEILMQEQPDLERALLNDDHQLLMQEQAALMIRQGGLHKPELQLQSPTSTGVHYSARGLRYCSSIVYGQHIGQQYRYGT